MTYNEFIKKLDVKSLVSNKSCQAICPTHNDKTASLTITDAGDKILLHCHAGCDNKNILNKLDLTEKDLFNNENQNTEVVAEYIYTDKDNKLLYKVMRFKPKNFIQAKYNNGEWIYKMTGVNYVLYNLPNVIKSDIIYFVEGEKDVDNLNKIGLVGTTTVGGASGFNKHKDAYIKDLLDKTIYIIPDNDEAGKKYAYTIKQSLKNIAKNIKVLNLKDELLDLKEKADISDVLEKYGKDKTLEIINKLKNSSTFPIENKDDINEDTFNKLLEYWNIKLSYDVITNKYIVKGLPPKYAEAEHINILPIYIMDNLRKKGIKVHTLIIEKYLSLVFAANNINPIKIMLESNKWDGIDRFEELYNILHLEKDFYKALVKKWLYQTVLLVYNNFEIKLNNEGVLTFQGEEHIGKSQFFKEISIKSEWFGDGLSIDIKDKDSLIRATNRWITEIGEADETINKNQPALKSFLSASADDNRAPYGRFSISRPRTTSFCATVNPQDFLKSPTGNRRFFVIPIKKIEHQKLKEFGREWVIQLWCQVYEKTKKDVNCYRLTEDEYKQLTKNNLLFTEFLPYEEELYELLEDTPQKKRNWTNNELISKYFSNATAQQLGKVLNKIHTNDPSLVTIKRNSKGYQYNMSLKEKKNNLK